MPVLSLGKHKSIEESVNDAIRKNDSIGGIIECRVNKTNNHLSIIFN